MSGFMPNFAPNNRARGYNNNNNNNNNNTNNNNNNNNSIGNRRQPQYNKNGQYARPRQDDNIYAYAYDSRNTANQSMNTKMNTNTTANTAMTGDNMNNEDIKGGNIPVLSLSNSLSQISFCDRECYNINNDKTKEDIINYVQNSHKINIIDRQYVTLDPNKIRNINHNEHLVATYSNGNPYLLLLTKIDETPCSIYIDRKCRPGYNYPKMHCVQYKFDKRMFEKDTLFTGELIRDINREWQFLISDILVYDGMSTRNKNILSRFAIINSILEKQYISDYSQEICPIYCKRLFQYRHIPNIFDKFMPSLSYVCKGLVFYTLNNQFSNYCWIMPRDHQIQVKPKHEYIDIPLPEDNDNNYYESNVNYDDINSEYIREDNVQQQQQQQQYINVMEQPTREYIEAMPIPMPKARRKHMQNHASAISDNNSNNNNNANNVVVINSGIDDNNDNGNDKGNDKGYVAINEQNKLIEGGKKRGKTLPRFRIIKTGTPDIYNLYMGMNSMNGASSINSSDDINDVNNNNNNNRDTERAVIDDERVCVAFIPDLATSKWLYEYFRDNKDRALSTVVECKYHTEFDKWVPVAICQPDVESNNLEDLEEDLAAVARPGMAATSDDTKKIIANLDVAYVVYI